METINNEAKSCCVLSTQAVGAEANLAYPAPAYVLPEQDLGLQNRSGIYYSVLKWALFHYCMSDLPLSKVLVVRELDFLN